MPDSTYHFVTRWRIEGTPEEVYRLLDEPTELPRWWPSVYLDVTETQTDQGKVFTLLTKGWLPYTLSWQFRRTVKVPFERTELTAWGDFVGTGVWTFRADGASTEAVYEWSVAAEKPLLRYLSFLLKPIFAANHRWAMARGEESMRLELARRRAKTDEERQHIPAPPGPSRVTTAALLAPFAAAVALAGLAAWLLWR